MIMYKPFLLTLLIAALVLSCSSREKYDPLRYLTREEQDSLILKTIRYSAKLPPNSSHETKFDKAFDPYYRSVAADYSFIYMHREEDGTLYFLISRPGRSLTPLFEGIGGKLKLNEKDSLIEYEEAFRMWKMPDNELRERGKFLFDRLVRKMDLTIYGPKFTGDQYIEFPDGRFSFDKESRMWRDNVFTDSLQTN
jgi:hypothetical protein